ncbi:hypothetical protein Tco_1397872 [Tanacetum coccineum]
MADLNVPANDVPVEQAPAVAPPIRTDDQILPLNKWVPIGKSNCVLDVLKSQRNPIFPIAVALLKNINFFRAFTASSTIPAIYIQQFWDTMCFNSSTGLYSCQLDEKWFNLHKDILRDALDITPVDDNNPFKAPPLSDTVIEYVNTLGYPSTLRNVSAMSVNALYQPWRAIPFMISMCLTEHSKVEEDVTESPKAAKATKSKTAKQTKPSAPKASKVTTPPKPTPTTTEPSKKDQSKKRKLVKETSDAPSPAKRSKAGKVTKQRKPKSPLQLVDELVDEGVPEQEPVYGDEEADVQRAMELSIKEQAEHTQGPARPVVIREPESGRIQPLSDVQGKGKEKVSDEGQAGSNPGGAVESQPQSSHAVHARPNLEHMDFEENLKLPTEDQVRLEEPASSAGTLYSLQNIDKELSFTNQFLVEKSQEDEPDKSNTEAEVQSMVTVPIHQDTSSVPLMTTPVIDLIMSQPISITVQAPLPTSTTTVTVITTTTSLPPPPPQPKRSTVDPILVRRIGELKQHMAYLFQDNLALGERLDKHGTWLYNLEKLDIPHKVSQAIDEIVTDIVDWAMQAPLRARFRDLPTVDMKEILQQRMFADDSYKANNQRKRRNAPRSPPGSPPSQPPPLPPPPGISGAPGTSGASGSSQLPPPLPPPSTGTSGSTSQQGRKVLSSSKTTASA